MIHVNKRTLLQKGELSWGGNMSGWVYVGEGALISCTHSYWPDDDVW